jgi:hypothetical protein
MTKNILITLFFAFITYAIVSSIGQPQHSYSAPNPIAVVD